MNENPPRQEMARLLKVVAHPVRLRILEELYHSSRCVKDLNSLMPDLSQPHLSQHISALRRVGLVDSHSDGALRCYYILRPSLVEGLVALIRAEHPVQERERTAVQAEAREAHQALEE